MKRSNDIRVYNIMLPLWLMLFWPSWLWLAVVPLNYIIDRIVLRWSLGGMPDKGLFCRKHNWKICLAGFLGDIAGAAIMLAVFMLAEFYDESEFFLELGYGVGFNPFSHISSFLVVAFCVAISAEVIYLLDKTILKRAGLDPKQAGRSALRLALITAPYLYFFPSSILYDSSWFSV